MGVGSEWMRVENEPKLLELCAILCFNFKENATEIHVKVL